MKVSTDDAIEAILYGVAQKQKIGLNMEEIVKVAKRELLAIWRSDMNKIESDTMEIYR